MKQFGKLGILTLDNILHFDLKEIEENFPEAKKEIFNIFCVIIRIGHDSSRTTNCSDHGQARTSKTKFLK